MRPALKVTITCGFLLGSACFAGLGLAATKTNDEETIRNAVAAAPVTQNEVNPQQGLTRKLPPGHPPTTLPATTTLDCGGKSYQVSVSGGECNPYFSNPTGKGIICENNSGDQASASCKDGCSANSKGSGSCTETKQ
jgi:hypothetical protein